MRLLDSYKILNIEEDCSDLEVRTAYRRKAKLIHPDKQFQIEDAASKFSDLNEAYRNVINHRKKLNKIKFKIIHEYEKEERNSVNQVMPIYKEMQKTFDDHMKTLDMIGSKLKHMKNLSRSFCEIDSSPPVFTQLYS